MNKNSKKKITKEEFLEIWNNYKNNIKFPEQKERRIVDQYNLDEIREHIQKFAVHCAAKGIEPSMETVIEWLYSTKKPNERDDFVKISRLLEMVKDGKTYPALVVEVLEYALKVEEAAIEISEELGHLEDEFESLKKLNDALKIRLEVKKSENLSVEKVLGKAFG